MSARRILVAGIGNIFFGDDAFGCEVAAELTQRSWPDGVSVLDFGIRGYDLAYAIMDGYDATILVDATPQGSAPGTIYLIEPDLKKLDELHDDRRARLAADLALAERLESRNAKPGT